MPRTAALRRALPCALAIALLLPLGSSASRAAGPSERVAPVPAAGAASTRGAADVAAARALFEKNLDAIRRRDRNGYLACYLHADTLARTGFDGAKLGYESFVKESGDDWP